jgi:hypothetical protein
LDFKPAVTRAEDALRLLLKSDTVELGHIEKLPQSAGAYALYRNGKLVYIGATDNLRRRLRSLRSESHIVTWRLRSKYGPHPGPRAYINQCLLKVLELDIMTAKLAAQIGISTFQPELNVELEIFEAW